jgi:hypothetical protein
LVTNVEEATDKGAIPVAAIETNCEAVTIPVNVAPPDTVSAEVALVVPIPTFPVTCNTVVPSLYEEIPIFRFLFLPLRNLSIFTY